MAAYNDPWPALVPALPARACVCRKSDSTVLMVQATEDRARGDGAEMLNGAMKWSVFGQGSVSSQFVVVARICVPAQVSFAQDQDMIQAL